MQPCRTRHARWHLSDFSFGLLAELTRGHCPYCIPHASRVSVGWYCSEGGLITYLIDSPWEKNDVLLNGVITTYSLSCVILLEQREREYMHTRKN